MVKLIQPVSGSYDCSLGIKSQIDIRVKNLDFRAKNQKSFFAKALFSCLFRIAEETRYLHHRVIKRDEYC